MIVDTIEYIENDLKICNNLSNHSKEIIQQITLLIACTPDEQASHDFGIIIDNLSKIGKEVKTLTRGENIENIIRNVFGVIPRTLGGGTDKILHNIDFDSLAILEQATRASNPRLNMYKEIILDNLVLYLKAFKALDEFLELIQTEAKPDDNLKTYVYSNEIKNSMLVAKMRCLYNITSIEICTSYSTTILEIIDEISRLKENLHDKKTRYNLGSLIISLSEKSKTIYQLNYLASLEPVTKYFSFLGKLRDQIKVYPELVSENPEIWLRQLVNYLTSAAVKNFYLNLKQLDITEVSTTNFQELKSLTNEDSIKALMPKQLPVPNINYGEAIKALGNCKTLPTSIHKQNLIRELLRNEVVLTLDYINLFNEPRSTYFVKCAGDIISPDEKAQIIIQLNRWCEAKIMPKINKYNSIINNYPEFYLSVNDLSDKVIEQKIYLLQLYEHKPQILHNFDLTIDNIDLAKAWYSEFDRSISIEDATNHPVQELMDNNTHRSLTFAIGIIGSKLSILRGKASTHDYIGAYIGQILNKTAQQNNIFALTYNELLKLTGEIVELRNNSIFHGNIEENDKSYISTICRDYFSIINDHLKKLRLVLDTRNISSLSTMIRDAETIEALDNIVSKIVEDDENSNYFTAYLELTDNKEQLKNLLESAITKYENLHELLTDTGSISRYFLNLLHKYAAVLSLDSEHEAALKINEKALQLKLRYYKHDPLVVGSSVRNLVISSIAIDPKKWPELYGLWDETQLDHPETPIIMPEYASHLISIGKRPEAISLLENLISHHTFESSEDNLKSIFCHIKLTEIFSALNDFKKKEHHVNIAYQLFIKYENRTYELWGRRNSIGIFISLTREASNICRSNSMYDHARTYLKRAIEKCRRHEDIEDFKNQIPDLILDLIDLEVEANHTQVANDLLTSEQLDQNIHPSTRYKILKHKVHCKLKQLTEAENLYEELMSSGLKHKDKQHLYQAMAELYNDNNEKRARFISLLDQQTSNSHHAAILKINRLEKSYITQFKQDGYNQRYFNICIGTMKSAVTEANISEPALYQNLLLIQYTALCNILTKSYATVTDQLSKKLIAFNLINLAEELKSLIIKNGWRKSIIERDLQDFSIYFLGVGALYADAHYEAIEYFEYLLKQETCSIDRNILRTKLATAYCEEGGSLLNLYNAFPVARYYFQEANRIYNQLDNDYDKKELLISECQRYIDLTDEITNIKPLNVKWVLHWLRGNIGVLIAGENIVILSSRDLHTASSTETKITVIPSNIGYEVAYLPAIPLQMYEPFKMLFREFGNVTIDINTDEISLVMTKSDAYTIYNRTYFSSKRDFNFREIVEKCPHMLEQLVTIATEDRKPFQQTIYVPGDASRTERNSRQKGVEERKSAGHIDSSKRTTRGR